MHIYIYVGARELPLSSLFIRFLSFSSNLISSAIIFAQSRRLDLEGGGLTITNTPVGKHVFVQIELWKAA